MGSFLISQPPQGKEALARCYDCQNRLLSTVAHDLKTPLNVMLGVGEELRRSLSSPADVDDRGDIAEGLDIILAMGADMARLIDGLLSSARMESGKEALEFSEVNDLSGILGVIAAVFRLEAGRRNIALRVELAPRLPTVYWDICRIRYHVLNNILSNALKYTQDGGTVRPCLGPPCCIAMAAWPASAVSSAAWLRQNPARSAGASLFWPACRRAACCCC